MRSRTRLDMKYEELVTVYTSLEKSSRRLDKTFYISELLRVADPEEIKMLILLLQGKVFATWDDRKTGVATRLVIKSINLSTGLTIPEIEKDWKETGDLGKTASNLISIKKQSTLFSKDLTIKKVFENIRKLSGLEGKGTVEQKIQLIAELLTSAKPEEARYITRTLLEDLRVGVGDGSMRDAIAWAFLPRVIGIFFQCKKCKTINPNTDKCLACEAEIENKFLKELALFDENQEHAQAESPEDIPDAEIIICKNENLGRECYNHIINAVQEAYDISNDFGIVAQTAAKSGLKGLKAMRLKVGNPIKCMLYPKAKNIEDAFETVGQPAAIEYKYDGFRMQVHKDGEDVKLFTRRFENVSAQFPEIIKYVKEYVKAKEVIFDAEAVGFDPKTNKYLPFQKISQRIRRKYNIDEMAKQFPVELTIFDIIFHDGKIMIKTPFEQRRKLMSDIVDHIDKKIVLSRITITKDVSEVDKFYHNALDEGHEGVMFKKLDAPYRPGARVGYGMKLKPVMESLDLVIVNAEWGEGKRTSWLTSYTVACIDENNELKEIGKVSTGLKELQGEDTTFEDMTNILKPLIIDENGKLVKVKPKVVIEVNYEEIQKSPKYASGYALRFPRFIRLRYDKEISEASTLEMIEEFFFGQTKR